MSDHYQTFTSSAIGRVITKNLGLPAPTPLRRYESADPLVDGTVAVGGRGRLRPAIEAALTAIGAVSTDTPDPAETYRALVFDATAITAADRLVEAQEFLTPLLRSLTTCARVVVLGTEPTLTDSVGEQIAQRALEGLTRSLGKEIGNGSTVNLVYVAPGAETTIGSTLAFFLSAKSAYVSGQVARLGRTGTTQTPVADDPRRPSAGRVAIVTGASRGIGEQIARVLHRDGATVLGIDVPQAASELQAVMADIDGDSLLLDITAKDAPARIAHHVTETYGGVDVVVHNAGITRDKKLANMSQDRWAPVIAVNVTAPERITTELLDQELINDNGRIIGVASIAGIAGNTGQTNYAASKAAVIGMVDALAPTLPKSITINAVAPGFIITQMTAAIPFATREVGQRLNAMAQGGLPVDVAETIAWYADPGSAAVNGNVVRVCGQMMLGA